MGNQNLKRNGSVAESRLMVEDLSEMPWHAVGLVLSKVVSGLGMRGWPRPEVVRGPRVVTADENYGLLGYPPDGASAEAGRTWWLDDGRMLRTQTSAMASGWLVENARRGVACGILAGIVHRRDVRDRTHCPDPHQADVWVLGVEGVENLHRLARDVVESACPGMGKRLVLAPSPHSYTEGGMEGSLPWEGGMLEVLECGLIAESLAGRLGLPEGTSGLALGMGLDRLAMVAKALPDIRLLRSEDPRVAIQMRHLGKWSQVASGPASKRDVSVVVPVSSTDEDLGEAVAEALSGEGLLDLLESSVVKGSWLPGDLPDRVVERLRLSCSDKNVLLGMTMRRHGGSVSKDEADRAAQAVASLLGALGPAPARPGGADTPP